MKKLAFLIFTGLYLGGCADHAILNEADFAYMRNSDLSACKKEAAEGDPSACTTLAGYYQNTGGNREEVLRLLRIAAKKGYPLAEHNLGVVLHGSKNPEDTKESQYWLKKAKEDGFVL